MAGRLSGRVAIVTGAASGIGRGSAEAMAAEGAKVAVADVDGDGAREVAAAIVGAGGEAMACTVDVSDEAQVRAAVVEVVERFGAVHVLHNNAAITDPGHLGRDGTVVDMDVALWDRTMAVNVRGPMLMCKHVVPWMVRAGGGSIVNTSSNAGRAGDVGLVAYGVSKGALNTLTLFVATAFGEHGIRCNAICPGLIHTAGSGRVAGARTAAIQSSVVLPRHGVPADVAQVAVFLASDDASFVTGQIISVDGGQLVHLPHYAQLRQLGLGSPVGDT